MKEVLFVILSLILLVKGAENGKSEVDEIRWNFLNLENQLWKFVDKLKNSEDHKFESPEVELIKRFQDFGDILYEKMPEDIKIDSLDSVWSWAKASSDLRGIYALYETFRRFQVQQTAPGRIASPKPAWLDLTKAILTDPKNNVNESITRVQETVLEKHLFSDVSKEAKDMICYQKTSPQQIVNQVYNNIAVTELKGYLMIQFSYMLLTIYEDDNYLKQAREARNLYEKRTSYTVDVAKNIIEKASRSFWKCDPQTHEKDSTYVEITQLLQGYVQNEVDLNPQGTCRENCAEYQYTKSHGCYQNLFCRQQRKCNGKILNCKYVDSDMRICTADPSSGRRYESIEYKNGLVYGRKMSCPRGVTKVDSWWRWLFWHCSYCLCICDEQGPLSDRYVNMRPYLSNTEQNMVVTGLRFVKKNRIIHLQIQQGHLEPYGAIDLKTVEWVPITEYHIHDHRIYAGQDYHVLSWEKRAIDLDDLYATHDDNKNYLVTGVRFKEIGSHLNFEIYISPFNYTTGKLLDPINQGMWKDNPNTDVSAHPRTKVNIHSPDISTRSRQPSKIMSKSDQFIEFIHTDLERDAAQTTVPFLDGQPLEMDKPTPLGGAGIFYKGQDGFGGFITPKIISYDVTSYLNAEFPQEKYPSMFNINNNIEIEPETN